MLISLHLPSHLPHRFMLVHIFLLTSNLPDFNQIHPINIYLVKTLLFYPPIFVTLKLLLTTHNRLGIYHFKVLPKGFSNINAQSLLKRSLLRLQKQYALHVYIYTLSTQKLVQIIVCILM